MIAGYSSGSGGGGGGSWWSKMKFNELSFT